MSRKIFVFLWRSVQVSMIGDTFSKKTQISSRSLCQGGAVEIRGKKTKATENATIQKLPQ